MVSTSFVSSGAGVYHGTLVFGSQVTTETDRGYSLAYRQADRRRQGQAKIVRLPREGNQIGDETQAK